MIFLGDLACPQERVAEFNNDVAALNILQDEIVVLNLEAVIQRHGSTRKETLYNSPEVLQAIASKAKKVIVSLANNHMYDYPEDIISTKRFLEESNIGVFGLMNSDGGFSPYEYSDGETNYAFFGHCWRLYTSTNPNRCNNISIVDVDYQDFLKSVVAYVKANPKSKVFCFMHWNYDLEKLPFPMHIRLSHDLIDAGVKGVIGSHPHVPQAVELYKGRPVAYSLGNFYLPSGIFFDGKLSYTEASKETIGIHIKEQNFEILRFETDKTCSVKLKDVEEICSVAEAFRSIPHYTAYFKKNRSKRMLVPVFKTYTGISYNIKLKLAIFRIKLIKSILTKLHR